MDSQNKISGSSPIPDDSIQVSNTNPSSKWKGRAVVQWNNSKINDVKYFGIDRGSKTGKFFGKILDRIFRKTHYTFDLSDGKRIYIRKKDLTHRLDLAQKVDSAIPLLKEITQEASPDLLKEIEVIHTTCSQLIEKATAHNKDVQKAKTTFAGKEVTLIALKNEEGKYDLYAKASSKSDSFRKTILGEGTYKQVIKVVDISNKQLMAMAKPRKNEDEPSFNLQERMNGAITDIKREYTITNNLKNKGVPYINTPRSLQMYQGKKLYNKYVYVSNLASKGSLKGYIDRNRDQDDSSKYKKWALQICQAIHEMHTKGELLHLDIKPDNILIGSNEEILITDFGLSTSTQESDKGAPRGTPNFIPPEFFLNNRNNWNPTEKYDAWAVGMTLFMLKYGTVDPTPAGQAFLNQIWDREIPKQVEEQLHKKLKENDPYDEVVKGLLAIDPSERMGLDEAIEKLKAINTTN